MLLYEGAKHVEEGGVFADGYIGNTTFRVNDELGGKTLDAILISNVGTLRIVDLKPGKLMLCYGCLPSLFSVAAIDSKYFNLAVVLLISLLQSREALVAPWTP